VDPDFPAKEHWKRLAKKRHDIYQAPQTSGRNFHGKLS
jgi:hypothetical protein